MFKVCVLIVVSEKECRAEKEIANNHLQIKRALYKLPGAEGGDGLSLGQPLLTAPGVKPRGTVLDVQVFSPDCGASVATTVPRWDQGGDQFAVSAQKSIPKGELVSEGKLDLRSF